MRKITAILVAAASSYATPCWSQEPGSRIQRYQAANIPDSSKLSQNDKAQETMLRYATCLTQYNPKRVDELLRLESLSPNYRKIAAKISTSECLNFGELRFQPGILRGSLFAAKYREEFSNLTPVLASTPLKIVNVSGEQIVVEQYIALRAFAECVVRAAPLESRELVLATIGSANEKKYVAALGPHLSGCLNQGNNVTFSKPVLVGMLAEVQYRLATGEPRAATENGQGS